MKKLLLTTLTVALLTLSLSACGYNLVGHGGGSGAIPADVKTVSLAVYGDNQKVLSLFRQGLVSDSFTLIESADVEDSKSHVVVRINLAQLLFVPSAYDIAGVATQYRMTYAGVVSVQRAEKQLWQSGRVQRTGSVYVTGGPASIEASRERLLRDLRKQWVSDALGRLRSGF